ncbi:MAG: hypothetical protein PF518_14875 [Spirochaetaceae bacterium]|jgi:rubrerythrin|nr:hypothetical protein [Spirochaetaceae bacterium]
MKSILKYFNMMSTMETATINQLEQKLKEYKLVSQVQQQKIIELVDVIEKMSLKSRGEVLYECPNCGTNCNDEGNIYIPHLQCPDCNEEFSRIGYRPVKTIYRKRE